MEKAAIFDLDGVLIDSTEAHCAAWQEVCRRRGQDLSREHFLLTMGQTNWPTMRILFGAAPADAELAVLEQEKEELYRQWVREKVVLIDGAAELIRALAAAGWRRALATSGPGKNVECVMGIFPAADLLEVKINADLVKAAKPAPDLFLRAAADLGVPPARSVVVEDSEAGLQAARSAGMKAVGLTTTIGKDRLLAAGATIAVDSLREVTPDIMAGLLEG